MKRTGMLEKKQIFGIRKLNVGVASVGIAAALFLSGVGQLVQAEEVVLLRQLVQRLFRNRMMAR